MADDPSYLAGPVTPPGTNTAIVNGNAVINGIDLTDAEKAIFKRDLSRIGSIHCLERDLYQLLMDESDALAAVAALAKGSIGTNPHFTGLLASGTEIGMQLIRAPTILSNNTVNNAAAVAAIYSWVQTYTANGWTNVFGSSSSYVDLSSAGISGVSITNTQNRVLLAIIALLDPVPSPQLQEVRFHIENVDYPVQPLAWLPATDIKYAKLQGIYVVPANGRFFMRGNVQPSTLGGLDQCELFGLTFAPGTYLTYE